jgi:hypothetical protein
MAINRTLKFIGYAYGNTAVTVSASINNTVVFNSTVDTLDQDIPNPQDIDFTTAPVLFSVDNSDLFTTDFSGSYPMTLTVDGGTGIMVGPVLSNYMTYYEAPQTCTMTDCAINGTTLTIGSVSSGNVVAGQVLTGSGILAETVIVSGNGLTWTVDKSQTASSTTITGIKYPTIPGNATGFLNCFTGTPTNSEGTPDCRSSVTINGRIQVPPCNVSLGTWTWVVVSGQTLECNFNVGIGNVS